MSALLMALSETAKQKSEKYSRMTEDEITKEYIEYPMIPYNTTITITRLGAINPAGKHLKYKSFRIQKPEEYKASEDPDLDYTDDDEVTPIIIETDDDKIYKVSYMHWFPLSDALQQICMKQAKAGRKLMPIELFIDAKDQWIGRLLALGM